MADILIVARMALDLITFGDPALPAGHTELVPIALLFATLHDLMLTLIGR